ADGSGAAGGWPDVSAGEAAVSTPVAAPSTSMAVLLAVRVASARYARRHSAGGQRTRCSARRDRSAGRLGGTGQTALRASQRRETQHRRLREEHDAPRVAALPDELSGELVLRDEVAERLPAAVEEDRRLCHGVPAVDAADGYAAHAFRLHRRHEF